MLTLADHEQSPAQIQFWIEEVQRRSGGSLAIQVTNRWRDQEVAPDQATLADVQAGKVPLAKVNASAYDTVGIDSFQALLAPLLIDNPTLGRRALESDLATQMLAGTDELGLVGLAVLPTDLRKPLGSRALQVVSGRAEGSSWFASMARVECERPRWYRHWSGRRMSVRRPSLIWRVGWLVVRWCAAR
jgi:hypothetical protein